MSTQPYVVVLTTGPDGPRIERITKVELLARLNGDYYGEGDSKLPIWSTDGRDPGDGALPDIRSSREWLCVIDGDVIEPKAVKVVTEYTL